MPVKLIDVAGLVPGAHEGKGLGNRFLDDARQADVLIHVVDAAGTTDIQGQPVPPGTHDPAEDVKFVEEEFDLWFLNIIRREWDKLSREVDQKRTKLADGIASRFTGPGHNRGPTWGPWSRRWAPPPGTPRSGATATYATWRAGCAAPQNPLLVAANKADMCGEAPELDGGGALQRRDRAGCCGAPPRPE